MDEKLKNEPWEDANFLGQCTSEPLPPWQESCPEPLLREGYIEYTPRCFHFFGRSAATSHAHRSLGTVNILTILW